MVIFEKSKHYTHNFANIYLIFEDNKRILLNSEGITEVNLEKGRHTVYAKENKLYSPVIEINIDDDDQVMVFEVGYNVRGIKALFDVWYCIFNKDDYIYIKKKG